MPELRLDSALVERGLAHSRTLAARWISEGLVTVDGRPAVKASAKVREEQAIELAGTDHYVSRAAHKLLAALEALPVVVDGRLCLDVGASTGGFSQVLLERGARRVIAIDVGHGQLDPRLASEPRLTLAEGVNARDFDAAAFRGISGEEALPQLVVADLSFIRLGLVLPALLAAAEPGADFVLLIKPQFEVGRGGVHEGLVRSAGLRGEAITGVLWEAWDLGLGTAGLLPSPIAGGAGNHEYLVWLSASVGGNPAEWLQRATEMAGD